LREVELKLHFPPGSLTKLEENSVFASAEAIKLHQATTYFDTPNAVLDKAGLTLRVRRIGKLRLQTLKSRADGGGVARNPFGTIRSVLSSTLPKGAADRNVDSFVLGCINRLTVHILWELSGRRRSAFHQLSGFQRLLGVCRSKSAQRFEAKRL
jgi:hypothetical protein